MSEMLDKAVAAIEAVPSWPVETYEKRVALAVMKSLLEPSLEMMMEGQKEIDLSEEVGTFCYISREEAADVWRAMMHTATLEDTPA